MTTREMPISAEHRLEWNDRLLDWLDGDVEAGEQSLIEAHLGECEICQAQLEEFRQLDGALRTAAPPMSLDATFDERLYAQIGAVDAASEEKRRAQARERIEQELQQNLHALSRGWRQALGFVIPAVIASVAIAFMLSVWLDNSGVTQQLVAHAPAGIARNSGLIHWIVIALLGTSLGVIVSRWLAGIVD
jgi:anti-sigma factor RsiW